MIYPASYKKINRAPGAINFVPDGVQMAAYPAITPGAQRIEGLMKTVAEKRQQIASGFYNDLMIMLTQQQGGMQMTAREVAERHEEKLLMLGPVLEQFHNEVLEIMTLRSFGICMRNGYLPPMPEEITKDELKVNFVSLLAQAQQMVDMPAITNTVGLVGNLVGLAPEVLDNLDVDEIARQSAIINGAPEKILRSPEDVEQLRKERAEKQAQQEQQMQMMAAAGPTKQFADAAEVMSKTPINGQNVLDQMMGAGGM